MAPEYQQNVPAAGNELNELRGRINSSVLNFWHNNKLRIQLFQTQISYSDILSNINNMKWKKQ